MDQSQQHQARLQRQAQHQPQAPIEYPHYRQQQYHPMNQHHGPPPALHVSDRNPGIGMNYLASQSQPQPLPETNEQVGRRQGYIFDGGSAVARRLAHHPGLRIAIQRRAQQQLNLDRPSNVQALFAQISGREALQPCQSCRKGHGPWAECVVFDGEMRGSCANCWFNASGSRCEFHEKNSAQAHVHTPTPDPTAVSHPLGASSDGLRPLPAVVPGRMAGFRLPPSPYTSNPVFNFHLEKALAEARVADRETRDAMMLEAVTKQLAVNIAQSEDVVPDTQG